MKTAMGVSLVSAGLPVLATASTAAANGSDDWMYVSAIGAAMLLFTLVVALCVAAKKADEGRRL